MRRALALALLLVGCASAPDGAEPGPIAWQAIHGRDHPLAGRIRDVGANAWIDEAQLFDALARADAVLIGERHDHPDHHALQARIVSGLAARGRRPAVAFEMLDPDDAAGVEAARRREGDVATRAAALRAGVAWDDSGWPDWALYAPVFEAALAADLAIVPANLTRGELHALGHGGAAALPPARRAALGLDAPADPDERQALAEQIREAHCGHAPDAALERMVDVQRAWNAQLARALADAAAATPGGGAVLVAGNEHVRRDRGAPRWLARFAPEARVAAVGLLEVDPGAPDAAPADADALPFDYVWWTPRLDLEDPCEKFRESLESMRKR